MDFGGVVTVFDMIDPTSLVSDDELMLTVQVWDENTFSDQMLGTMKTSIMDLFDKACEVR